MKKQILIIIVCLLIAVTVYYFLNKKSSSIPQTQNIDSNKSIEDYFVENMQVSREEAKEMAVDGVILRVSKDTTLMGIVGSLYAFGFIDNEGSFNELLETASDTTPGKEGVIKVGDSTIDIQSNYNLNYDMTDEQISDTRLNKGKFEENFTRYNYLFMPGGPGNGSNERPER